MEGSDVQNTATTHTVDGRNPANQLRLVVHPIIYRVLYISGGAGFQPSTVLLYAGTTYISLPTYG